MDQHVLFLLLGLGTGAVYAIFGLGLVLEYRSSGVVNFAHGTLAMFVAYAYLDLRQTGDLLLPVVAIPHRISVFDGGLDTFPAFVIALVYAAVLGLAVFFLIFRPLRSAPPLARLVASVGLMIALQAMIVLNLGDDAFGISGQSAGNILPNEPVEVLGTMIPRDRFYLAALTIIIGVVLWAVFRFTTFGLATRGAAESEKGAAVCGYSSTRLGAVNWMVATVMAGAAGILITPISGLDPTTFTLLVVPALGAALLGRLTSFSITLIAGLAIGMLQSDVTKLTLDFDWLPKSGLQEGLPFVVIIFALVFAGRSIPWRNALVDRAMPAVGRPRHIVVTAVASLVVGVVALYTLVLELRLGLIQSLIIVLLGMSLVLVTGLAGQISLAQMAIAGFGGFMFGIFANDLGVPFPFSLVVAGLATAPLGVLVGLPALRTRGLYLAVLTLAAAVALDAFLFKNTDFTGGALGRRIPAASIFGIDLNIRSFDAQAYPRPEFGVLVLVVVVLVGIGLAVLRRSSLGQQMLATRANERAAIASGVSMTATKLFAFGAAAFIAGLAGSMIGLSTGNLSGNQFQVFASLVVVALVYIGGIARISGAVIAGVVFAPNGFGPTLLDNWFGIGRYAVVIGGVGLVVMTIVEPDGLSAAVERGRDGSSITGRPARQRVRRSSRVVRLMTLLELRDVVVAFGGLRAVDGVSLRVEPGAIVGLIGPNGAGKSTIIDAVTGFVPVASGTIAFEGQVVTRVPAHRRARLGLTRTFQSLELFEDLTVAENVRVPTTAGHVVEKLANAFVPRRHAEGDAVAELLAKLGLADKAGEVPSVLSQAERRSLAMARALAAAPKLVMLDEPAAGLDTTAAQALGAQMRTLVTDDTAILLVDHDMSLVLGTCDYVYVIDAGRLIAEGTPAEVRRDPAVLQSYLGEEPSADLTPSVGKDRP